MRAVAATLVAERNATDERLRTVVSLWTLALQLLRLCRHEAREPGQREQRL